MKSKIAPLRVALVGCGNVVQNHHCPALLQLEKTGVLNVAAVLEPVLSAQQKILSKFPSAITVQTFDQLAELEIDFAIVCSPTHLHAEHSLQLLNAGISVLCEKPMATTVADATAMIDAAKNNEVLLAVGFLGRFASTSLVLLDTLRGGVLGDCHDVLIRRGNRYSGRRHSNWRFDKNLAGGGVLMDIGVHMIDAMIWWFGDPIRIVSYQDDASANKIEENCRLQLEFASGLNADLKLSRDFDMPWLCKVSGTKGWIRHDGASKYLQLSLHDASIGGRVQEVSEVASPLPEQKSQVGTKTDPFLCQLENFTAALMGKCELAVPGTEGIKSLLVVEESYQVRKPLSADWLDAEEIQIAQRSRAQAKKAELGKIAKTLGRIKQRLLKPNRRQQWPQFTEQDFLSLRSTFLESDNWSGGAEVSAFTREFTEYLGVKHGVLVNSGTSALEIAVRACGIGPGDEVIVPSYTFYSSASCIARAGARPVFVDVRLEDSCIDPAEVEILITEKTRALIVVHFGGHPADMETLLSLCKTHNLFLIEDAAHAPGSEWNGKPLGSIGDFGCFSFHSSKPLASGEGGFIATSNGALYQKAQALADFGILPGHPRYEHSILGSNVRISKFQAAIFSIQLKKLDSQILLRERNVSLLLKYLQEIEGIKPSTRAAYATRLNHYIFGFFYEKDRFGSKTKAEFANALRREGIPCLESYESPLYDQPVFKLLDESLAAQSLHHKNALKICSSGIGLDQGFLLSGSANMKAVARALLKIQAGK